MQNSTDQRAGSTTTLSRDNIPLDPFRTAQASSTPEDPNLALSKSSFEIPRDNINAPFGAAPKSPLPMAPNLALSERFLSYGPFII